MKTKLPKIICSSVIRSSNQGNSHGGVYLVDFNEGTFNQVVDWDDPNINWKGRGADRGLRGICFYNNFIIMAASDEIYFYDHTFKIVKSFRHQYLRHCHETYINEDKLYLSSTGYDSILTFDLKTEKFGSGYSCRNFFLKYGLVPYKISRRITFLNKLESVYFRYYNTEQINDLTEMDTKHLNNVFVFSNEIYFSGLRTKYLYKIDRNNRLSRFTSIPQGTHNVRLIDKNTLIFNYTAQNKIVTRNLNSGQEFYYNHVDINHDELESFGLNEKQARVGFGRGLTWNEDYFFVGTSPATISCYKFGQKSPVKSINLSNDVRNSIHGLEIYPY